LQDIMIETVDLVDEAGKRWELCFYIRAFKDTDVSYGIKVERISGGEVHAESTLGISHSYEEVLGWTRKLAKGKVGPFTLHDIVDELVG